ncbi:MAG: alpha glucosidase [Gammaproteobacteria bacterium]|nr:alpha glucosidase [Gammaproteobacteria bacterium]NNM12700.1 alpha glucosidase [Gammaproteobacteria bacterium]
MDANNDGTGDLRGIIQRFDHLVELGIDAIWISPFFKSPMNDFGYDVSDYRAIDPLFGSMQDFDELVTLAHSHDIKIIIDQVPSHSSDEHPWFIESRSSQDNPKADWYVWADANPDGTPPNNWLSVFGGSAWHWEPRRGQYYLHNFLVSQPDLNFHNPEVRKATLENMEFWLQKGVDGFRLDAIIFCFHDRQLRDNPAKKSKDNFMGSRMQSPYAMQEYRYQHTQDENLEFMQDIRALLERYPGTVSLGEIGTDDSISVMAEYTKGDNRLHMAYSFDLLSENATAAHIREVVETSEQKMRDGWPCYALSNHDVMRVLSRWDADTQAVAAAKAFNFLLGTLRGSFCVYQGEELGLCEADIKFDELQDPYGKTFWPIFKGRDGCRTPIPWEATKPHAGFSNHKPWLPIPSEHAAAAVAEQKQHSDSVLNAHKTFLAWRKKHPALIQGDIEFIDTPEPVIAFRRFDESSEMQIFINLSGEHQSLTLDLNEDFSQCSGYGAACANLKTKTLEFTPYSVFVIEK